LPLTPLAKHGSAWKTAPKTEPCAEASQRQHATNRASLSAFGDDAQAVEDDGLDFNPWLCLGEPGRFAIIVGSPAMPDALAPLHKIGALISICPLTGISFDIDSE
jgi:hypothetical protein